MQHSIKNEKIKYKIYNLKQNINQQHGPHQQQPNRLVKTSFVASKNKKRIVSWVWGRMRLGEWERAWWRRGRAWDRIEETGRGKGMGGNFIRMEGLNSKGGGANSNSHLYY